MRLLLVCALALLGATAVVGNPEKKLIKWIEDRGGEVGFEIGKACKSCPRGVLASKDYKEGDLIAKVPVNCSIKFTKQTGFASEYAHELLERMHKDPKFNQTYALFLATQPAPNQTFTPEVYTDAHLEMLQHPELERLARSIREVAEQVYEGKYEDHKPLSEVVGEGKVTLQQFKHYASLVASRMFGFHVGEELPYVYLVPALDMLNNAEEPNSQRDDDGKEFFLLKAIKPIAKGEAITQLYQPYVIHRPDMALLHYGYVPDMETPLLPAVDLPFYDHADPWKQTYPNDAAHDPKVGGFATAEERNRLAALLKACPTTEEEDAKLLASGKVKDWRERAILELRVVRKKALKSIVDKISKGLEERAKESAKESAAEL